MNQLAYPETWFGKTGWMHGWSDEANLTAAHLSGPVLFLSNNIDIEHEKHSTIIVLLAARF